MKQGLYSVYDTCAAFYNHPFCAKTDNQAARDFKDAVANPNTPMHNHPEHFYLTRIGTFDDNKGTTDQIPAETILTGLEAVAENNQRGQSDLFDDNLSPGGTD